MRIKIFRRGICVGVVKPDFLGMPNVRYYPWRDLGISNMFTHEQSIDYLYLS